MDRTGDEPDVELVRRLIRSQMPDLRHLPVESAGRGWDNEIFRVGNHLAARLPRRPEGASLILHERRWLPVVIDGIANRTRGGLDASPHLHVGEPGLGYPWPWAICTWWPGRTAIGRPLRDPTASAARLGRFVSGLQRAVPEEAPVNPYRGGPLETRSDLLLTHVDRLDSNGRTLGSGITRSMIEDRWADLVGMPIDDAADRWLHGDLHPGNLVMSGGELSAVIDFGDLCRGDRATDLAVAWSLFGRDPDAASVFREQAGRETPIDDDTWRRAEAWALALAVAHLAGEDSTDTFIGGARRTLAVLFADPG